MKRILVPVDFSDVTARVVETAAHLAHAFGAAVRLLHVAAPDPAFVGFDVGPQVVRDERAEELRAEHRDLQRWAADLGAEGLDARAVLVQGATAETILEQAATMNADVIVLGSHGHGALFKALLGSVSERVIRASGRPVLIVPSKPDA